MESALCSRCAGLSLSAALEQALSVRWTAPQTSARLESPWHGTLADVEASAASCGLCRVVMKGWQRSREVVVEQAKRDSMFDPRNPPMDLDKPVAQISKYRYSSISLQCVERAKPVDDGRKNRSSQFLQIQCGPNSRASYAVLDPVTVVLRIAHVNPVKPVTDEKTPEAGNEALTPLDLYTDLAVPADPLSQQSLGAARGWLETCVRNHEEACGSQTKAIKIDGWLPTRLLEIVSDGSIICLRVSRELKTAEDVRYLALSHCWGPGGTPFTTTRQTMAERMNGIVVRSLPQTFQDSVKLAKNLGLQYLWIDSLCIVQDDADDWAREAAQMANVYRNAHLVLNASNSNADASGFLAPRDNQDTVYLPLTSSGKQQICLQLCDPEGQRWTDIAGLDNLSGEPISARAWCLQERFLPLRALLYGTTQAFWECERMRASEDGDVVAQEGSHLKRLCRTGNITQSVFARSDRSPSGEREQNTNWADWYRMIEDYTARNITATTDRLPALSGLAQAVALQTKGDYLAGLWKSGLLEGLLWCKARPGQALTPTPAYVAPSWSWASVVGPVQFPVYTWYAQRAYWKAKMADFEPLAECVRHLMARRDVDAYGRLTGGYVVLKAPQLSVASVCRREDKASRLRSMFGQEPARAPVADLVLQLEAKSGTIWIEGGFDDPNYGNGTAKLSVVFLTRLPHVLEEGFVEHRFGLVLERADRGGYYKRVGFVDGVVLSKAPPKSSFLDAFRKRDMFSVVGFDRPFEKGDLDSDKRDNILAANPFTDLGTVEVMIR